MQLCDEISTFIGKQMSDLKEPDLVDKVVSIVANQSKNDLTLLTTV